MRRVAVLGAMLIWVIGAPLGVRAQEGGFDSAFSDSILRSYGYPETIIRVGPEGIEAPSSLPAGYHLISLYSAAGYSAYLDFMQPPAGLSEEEATELALAAARDDLAQPGWVYAGGNNTFIEGEPTTFIVHLGPGKYQMAASYYLPEQGSEEIMQLVPLTVTDAGTPVAGAASPAAGSATPAPTGEPAASVTLEATDGLRYLVSPDPVPSGPQVWKFTNTGQNHAHHVVMTRVPDDVTADQIVGDFTSLMSGTPPAGPPLVAQFTFVGYSALISGGHSTWVEFDLEPASYAVVCYIIDPATGRPHVVDGMLTVFTVV